MSDPEAWRDRAACLDAEAEVFFPLSGGSTVVARAFCDRCPVRAECLEYAVDRAEPFGIWGGMSELDRRRLAHPRGLGRRPRSKAGPLGRFY